MMKQRSVEDLEKFILDMTSVQKYKLMNFASTFIAFISEFFIEDEDMRIILAGVRILSRY